MNKEAINDLTKLAYHRLVARELKASPRILDEARFVVHKWMTEKRRATFVEEWDHILSQSLDEVRRDITRRSPGMKRLRISSPFFLIPEPVVQEQQRRRIWQIAKRVASVH